MKRLFLLQTILISLIFHSLWAVDPQNYSNKNGCCTKKVIGTLLAVTALHLATRNPDIHYYVCPTPSSPLKTPVFCFNIEGKECHHLIEDSEHCPNKWIDLTKYKKKHCTHFPQNQEMKLKIKINRYMNFPTPKCK